MREPSSLAAALANYTFDAVVNFLDYTGEHAATSVTVFAGRARHYVHISSAAVYHKPGRRLPYRESSARRNPYLDYATHKLDAEETFLHAHQLADFPVTIVRPAHAYDQAAPPLPGGWTVVDRLARGDEVVVHGDGTSLWTVTHARDFAAGLTGLLGNEQSIGETFHITSNFVYSWNEIYAMIAAGFGVEPRLVHLPSELLPVAAPDWNLATWFLGDYQWSLIFDNAKICDFVPDFSPSVRLDRAVPELVAWRSAHPAETAPDPKVDTVLDRLVHGFHELARIFESLLPASEATATR